MSTERNTDDAVIDSAGNVFADLDLPSSSDDILKVEIARVISNTLQEYKLTQSEAARRIGIDQPKISKIVRGNLKEFSAERLIEYLLALGCDIDVHIKAPKQARGRITIAA
ncbi:helix-turn-helix transcriptional regulator [Filomicrobium sp.]|uniref:helix-turn-helix domain-containing protein n=1 Tax=Filomicrobium sp. TaxID=2024831 RepID=UPI00258D22CF|nr:helix-turn-helix transcriptional regulator [Filomicrobium sp.]MCV0371291.1 helix-turn-helix domain-containing protein [Filomicrobium sp.]